MPDFRGLSKKTVLNRCIDLGIHLQSEGSGVAIFQSPSPGSEVPVGGYCNVKFTKTDLKRKVAGLEVHPAARQGNPQLSSSISP
ncbi:MAG: PASTA domain-containing protein, partial [Acidobacteriota bacterium]